MGVGWSTPRPDRFTPGKETRYPLYRRLGRPQGRSGLVLKISPSQGFDPRTVQHVASRYTDYAIPAHGNKPENFYYLSMGWAVRGSIPSGGEIFRTSPDRPSGPPSLLFNGYRVKRPECGVVYYTHLAPTLKKKSRATCTPPLGFRGLF